MKEFCAIVGFQIDRERDCRSSGKHPACRECMGMERVAVDPRGRKKTARKRCECGRPFIPGSNRQRFCEKCGGQAERKRKREWARGRRKMAEVTV